MKKTIVFFILLFTTNVVFSQIAKKEQKKHIKSWQIDQLLGIADTIPVDTVHINYQAKDILESHSIANLYTANYGSPIQSKIYQDRIANNDFLFENSYKPYLLDIENNRFYDSTVPYTNLTYLTGGKTGRKEEQVKFIFTAGPSEKMNLGLNLDYIHSIGQYNNQAAKRFAGNIFGRYNGKYYSMYAFLGLNNHSNHENGGLSDLSLLTNKDVEVKHKDMPIFMQGFSNFRKKIFFYNHSYSIGINREVKVNEDSTRLEYIPVTKFGHTLQLKEMKKRYFEPIAVKDFYLNTYNEKVPTNDTAAVRSISNTFSINLAEEFNKWMKFGITGYVENEIQQFTYKPDTTILKTTKSNTRIGGALTKSKGTLLRYRLLGDIYLIGYKLGEFRLMGNATGDFKLGKEPIIVEAEAYIKNEEPSFFLQNYYSNHFRWENNFTKTYKTHIGGSINLPKRKSFVKLDIENVTNHIYFTENGNPTQHNGNVQIFAIDVRQDVSFRSFTLENNAIYQISSQQSIIPLPTLSLYHNLYYHDKWFKDFFVQLGSSVRYHTSYYAPAYIPATGQFANQSTTKIGNYPFIDVYGNFHLKQARFFVKYTNIGYYFMKDYGMLMPNYAVNPPMFKFGLSWNFYD